MRSSELYEALDAEEEVGAIRQTIADVMPAFRTGLARRGGSAPVEVKAEGGRLLVAESHVRKICEEFLAERLDDVEVEFVATALELCPDFVFASEGIEEAVSLLSDSVANGPLTREVATTLRDGCRG